MSINKPAGSEEKLFFSGDNRYRFWRILNVACAGLLCLLIIWTGIFIYRNVYSTQQDAQIIALLNKNLSLDVVNVLDFQTVKKIIDEKNNETAWPDNLRNVFFYVETSATSTYATTSVKK